MGKVAPRELAVNGITTYEQLTTLTPKDLLKIHGVGPKAVRILREELKERGPQLRGRIAGSPFAAAHSGAKTPPNAWRLLATTTPYLTP